MESGRWKRLGAVAAIALLTSVGWAGAQDINPNVGTTGFGFLKIGVSARPAGLGGAFVAVADDVNSIAWNPAALATLKRRVGTASYTSYLVDTQSGFLAMAQPLDWGGVLGVGINYMSYGELRKTDEEGKDLGSFGAGDLALRISLSRFLLKDDLSLGINLKAIYSRIDTYSSDAYVLDLGIFMRALTERTTLGASALNLGFVRSGFSGDFKDELPVILKIGFSHHLAHLPLMIVGDLNIPNDNDVYFSVGGEFTITDNFFLRPGYNSISNGMGEEERPGLSVGVGFAWKAYQLDYAFTSFAKLGDVHRVSLSGEF